MEEFYCNEEGSENAAENPYGIGSSSGTGNDKTENTNNNTLVTEEGLEVKEDLFAAEDLGDLDDDE